ncbi:MAG: polA [Patescibacteria group bacterium]|nr:polA [Patescibacteria group bacterium]
MNKKLFLIVDGNGLLYRAYHAFPKELTTPKGELIGAVYGFTRMMTWQVRSLASTK